MKPWMEELDITNDMLHRLVEGNSVVEISDESWEVDGDQVSVEVYFNDPSVSPESGCSIHIANLYRSHDSPEFVVYDLAGMNELCTMQPTVAKAIYALSIAMTNERTL